jgi:hypothetical protein
MPSLARRECSITSVLPLAESVTVVSTGLFCVLMPATFLVMIPITGALERWRLQRARARFLQGRLALPDAAFLNQLDVSADQAVFFLAARRAMPNLSGVPSEMIHPADTWRTLMNLQWDSGYIEDIIFGLERELNSRLPLAYPTDDRLPFAVYVSKLATVLQHASEANKDFELENFKPWY